MTNTPKGRQETVLVVEDDGSLRLSLTLILRQAGFRVVSAKTGPEGVDLALSAHPDLVLLDVMLPGMNGFEVCETIREKAPDLPILMVTAKGEEQDRVQGLRRGADDYIVKPFGSAELLARIDAALRRPRRRAQETQNVVIGLVRVDFGAHRMLREGKPVDVTAHELKVLRFFLGHEGELLSRQRILDAVWGADYFGTDRTVDNFITRLRAKIEKDPRAARHIVTVRGAGYRFSRVGDGEGDDP